MLAILYVYHTLFFHKYKNKYFFLLEISNIAIKDFYQPMQTGGLFQATEYHSLGVI